MKIAFIADPLDNFDPIAETTFFLMHEMCSRQWHCYHIELKNLYLVNHDLFAICKQISVTKKKGLFEYRILQSRRIKLDNMDAVLLRKDPPFDLNYLDHLTLLELLSEKTLVINNPTGIKIANEKLFTFHFEGITARSIVTQNNELIRDFVRKEKKAVLKPLNLSGGRGIVCVTHDDPSLNSIIDILTENQNRFIMAQEFLPEAKQGDKRILILDGEILGAFKRRPPKTDFRGNLHSGARLIKTKITKRDKEIVALIKENLNDLGLLFVGVDVLGDKVTEINSTSPMGIKELNQNDNSHYEKIVVNWLQNKIINNATS